MTQTTLEAWQDPKHPSNKIRPKVKCWGCGKMGCVGKHWGNWCFECNVKRIGRIDKGFSKIATSMGIAP